MSPMGRWRRAYGGHPLHLLATLVALAVGGYALLHMLRGPHLVSVAIWLGGAALLHDLVALPAYSALDRLASRATGAGRALHRRAPLVVYLRLPALGSLLALLVFFPLILRLSGPRYRHATGLSSSVYLGRWLAITAALFAISAIAYALARLRGRGSSAGTLKRTRVPPSPPGSSQIRPP